jgi:hypothetical protein
MAPLPVAAFLELDRTGSSVAQDRQAKLYVGILV